MSAVPPVPTHVSEIIPLLTARDFIERPQWPALEAVKLPAKPRILILKLSAIGDCLVASPVSRALRERYPEAHIAWAVQAKAKAVVEGNPNLDEVLVWSGGWKGAWKLAREVRKRQFDAVLDLQGAFKSAPIAALSGARHRIVSSRGEGIARRAANYVVPMPSPPPHASEQYLRIAQALDIDANTKRQLLMPIGEADRAFANQFWRDNGLEGQVVVGLNPGSARVIKQWPPQQFAGLAALLSQKNIKSIIFGAPNEVELAQQIVRESGVTPVLAAGKTNLKQLGALLEKCAVVVTGDTGPMHIAAGVGIPIVALFGPTDPRRTGPVGLGSVVVMRDLPCRPCFQQPTCQRFECLTELEAADVARVVEGEIGRRRLG